MTAMMKTLVLGLGNPILTDDGIGPRVARELQEKLDRPEVTVTEASLGGLNVLDLLAGYDRAIIIDAIKTPGGKPGRIYRLLPESLDATRHTTSPHDVSLTTALELGNRLGMALPSRIDIFAIEAADTSGFSEECTPAVAGAIPACIEMIIEDLKGGCDT